MNAIFILVWFANTIFNHFHWLCRLLTYRLSIIGSVSVGIEIKALMLWYTMKWFALAIMVVVKTVVRYTMRKYFPYSYYIPNIIIVIFDRDCRQLRLCFLCIQGDSGGPLMTEMEGRWTLIGIVSAGYSCAKRGQPGIYHRVAHTSDWISHSISSWWCSNAM